MSDQLKEESFTPYVNSIYRLRDETVGMLELKLISITGSSNKQAERFSLVFKGPLEQPFAQKIYSLSHPQMGEIALFLVPIAYGKPDALYYEAVFNRLLE